MNAYKVPKRSFLNQFKFLVCHFIHFGPLTFNIAKIIPKSTVTQAFSLKNTGQINAISPKKY